MAVVCAMVTIMAVGSLRDRGLVEWYYRYVGEPERMRDVYGYWLFLLGCLAGLVGVLGYLVEQAIVPGDLVVREVAIISAAFGLVVALCGINVLLPVRRRGLLASVFGAIVAFVGIGLFAWAYPTAWYVPPDYSPEIIAVFGTGITIIAAVAILVPIVTGEKGLLVDPELGIGSDEPPILLGQATRDAFYAVYETPTNDWAWRMIRRDAIAEGAEVASDDTDARLVVEDVRETIGDAGLLDLTSSSFRLYRTPEDAWRWSLVRQDGGVVAVDDDLVEDRDRVETDVTFLKEHAPTAEVVEIRGAAIDIYRDEADRWRWRLIDDRRQELAQSSESFGSEDAATDAGETFVDRVEDARVLALERIGFELYEDADGWRWRIVDAADDRLAVGEAVHEDRQAVEDAATVVADGLEDAPVIEAGTAGFELVPGANGWQWRLRDETDTFVAERHGDPVPREAANETAERTREALEETETIEFEGADYEVYPTEDGWRWRLVSADRELLAESADAFADEEAARTAASGVRERALNAELLEFDEAAFQQYESGGEWRWRLIDEDGQVMADSGEEYESQEAVRDGMMTLKENAPDADVLEIEFAAFEIYRNDDNAYAWRLIDEGGRLIADGASTHPTREAARDAVDFLTDHVEAAEVRNMDTPAFQFYRTDEGWLARLIDVDGTILARTSETASTRDDAGQLVETVVEAGADAGTDTVGPVNVLLRHGAEWHWQLVDSARERIAAGERTYESRDEAVADAEALIEGAGQASTFAIGEGVIWLRESAEGWEWTLIDGDRAEYGVSQIVYAEQNAALEHIEVLQARAPEAGTFDIDTLAYETFLDDDVWRWRLIDEDERELGRSAREFETREDAVDAIDATREAADEASILEIDEAAFEFHEREDGWVWRLVDGNGSPLAESVEGYPSRQAAREDMLSAKEHGAEGETVVTW